MGALPSSQPAGIRYASYIEELHEFLATGRIPYGSESDLPVFVAHLQRPGPFADDLSSLIRSFILRQGGSMPHAEILEILSLAVGGPELALHPQQHSDSLRQLLSFIAGVQRRPWNMPPNAPGEVVPFPADPPEPQSGSFGRPEHIAAATAAIGAVPPRSTGIRRSGIWVALASIAALAVGGVVFARMHSASDSEIFHVQPAPLAASPQNPAPEPHSKPSIAQAPTPPAPIAAIDQSLVGQPSPATTHPAKPSPYGEAPTPPRSRPVQSQSDWANAQSGQSYSPAPRRTIAGPPQSAAGNPTASAVDSAATTVFAPYNSTTGATQPPAPIVRQPAYRDPDSYIAGDVPASGTARAAPSYFTVSSGVMAANLISSPDPVYPLLARVAHVQGQVTLLAVVAKDGTVEATRVLRGSRLLRSAAEDAVRQFRYRPYRIDGHAVDVATVVTVDFHDQADPPQQ
jgi:TonB family protein